MLNKIVLATFPGSYCRGAGLVDSLLSGVSGKARGFRSPVKVEPLSLSQVGYFLIVCFYSYLVPGSREGVVAFSLVGALSPGGHVSSVLRVAPFAAKLFVPDIALGEDV